ncbi:hypothetical protein BKA67DRAFT_657435 [Truncatella angustata]|uniref:Uncharacterized protein n=1 Tax=Truncatella angustata TaxID=152316 RepID=A0A9P8UNG5_9PEZI|nr:uncharacterized protein BKA67DRAFT_657435 [Truncatella angustata]KAH6655501.1 hypothetical protein BKA67DRAFT_657435 [Truncatella angustata]KAH8199686.1 hypothetical protein TruAng_006155 [Truncatella angustata]
MSYTNGQGDLGYSDDGGNSSSNSEWPDSPFKWVLVPICILIVAAFIVTFLRYRKRHKQRNSRGMTALERDLEAMGPNRVRRTGSTRWQWVSDGQRTGRRVGLGVGSREEGLNELGEAPPAYAPPPKSSEDVELHDMPPSPVSSYGHVVLPSSTGSPFAHEATPPAYGEAPPQQHAPGRTSNTAEPQQLSVPTPAVLPSH